MKQEETAYPILRPYLSTVNKTVLYLQRDRKTDQCNRIEKHRKINPYNRPK